MNDPPMRASRTPTLVPVYHSLCGCGLVRFTHRSGKLYGSRKPEDNFLKLQSCNPHPVYQTSDNRPATPLKEAHQGGCFIFCLELTEIFRHGGQGKACHSLEQPKLRRRGDDFQWWQAIVSLSDNTELATMIWILGKAPCETANQNNCSSTCTTRTLCEFSPTNPPRLSTMRNLAGIFLPTQDEWRNSQ